MTAKPRKRRWAEKPLIIWPAGQLFLADDKSIANMDDNIDDEAVVATYVLPRIMREKRKRLWIMQRLALCYYISKYEIIYAFKLRCCHCVEYNTHYAV